MRNCLTFVITDSKFTTERSLHLLGKLKKPLGYLIVLCFVIGLPPFSNVIAAPAKIWFAPLDDYTRQSNAAGGIIPISESAPTDYMNLFDSDASWPQAANQVAVFKMYNDLGMFSDAELSKIFSFLKQHNIDLALEFGPLVPANGCGTNNLGVIEGFTGASAQLVVDRIKQNGGTLKYIAMDEPFYYANMYDGPGACHWTPQQIASNAAQSLAILRAAFPNLQIGDIEPSISAMLPANWVANYAAWMDAFQVATGMPLAFFHADYPPPEAARTRDLNLIRAETSKRSIPFGILYTGLPSDSSDMQWLARSEDFFTTFELSNSPPEDAIHQSWMAYPRRMLPETTPNTFTWLINRYARKRTNLTIGVAGTYVNGKLTDTQGTPIGAATISVTVSPSVGPGLIYTYSVSGTVPTTIRQGIIQLGVDQYGFQGPVDINFYSYQYADSAGNVLLDFSQGLSGWGGTAPVKLTYDEVGASAYLLSTTGEAGFFNSRKFAITPGSPYTLAIKARISPDSVSSGYFAMLFIGDLGVETSRVYFPFSLPILPVGSSVTSNDGAYSLQSSQQNVGGFKITASYSGADETWPATATLALNSPSDCLFNWAEGTYPTLFAPVGATSLTSASYYYRYYSQTNAYLGASSVNSHVYYKGPATNNSIVDEGALTTWLTTAGCQ